MVMTSSRWVVKPHPVNQVLKVIVLLLSLLDIIEALVHMVKCVHHLILTSLQVGDAVVKIMGAWLMRLLKVLLQVRVVVVLWRGMKRKWPFRIVLIGLPSRKGCECPMEFSYCR
jgi:hypothetical protein